MAKRKYKNKEMKNSSKKLGFGKKVASMFLAVWISMMIGSVVGPVAFADITENGMLRGTLLPYAGEDFDAKDCEGFFLEVPNQDLKAVMADSSGDELVQGIQNLVLSCAIKSGRISLWMVPYFIKYIIEFILYVGGLLAVAGIVYGGATYIFSGLSNDKEKGKKAIMYSIGGMILMYMAWAIVNIVIGLLTG